VKEEEGVRMAGDVLTVNEQDVVGLDPAAARTYPELLRAAASAYGDDVAITLTGETIPDDRLSFVELERRSAELARGLIARGVGKGTRVGFIFGNSPSFALMLAAIARVGAIAIPISTLLKADELVRVLRQSDLTGLIVQRRLLGHDYVARLCDALPELRSVGPELRILKLPYLRWIISTGEDLPAAIHGMEFLTGAASTVSEALLREVEAEVHPTDQMLEIYTSGSMALPKGVKHNHGPVLFRTHWLRPMLQVERHKNVPAVLPMFWVGGLMMYLLPGLAAGAVVTCTEGTSTSSRFAMGTVMAEDDLKAMPRMGTIWALGMSETLGPYSYADELRVPGYPLCAPLDHVAERFEIRIADENGQPVPEGERGEIQVRGYAVTPGLHKIERAEYFEEDGFYRTGDMGFAEGRRILFVGRNGDMIKSASSNVSPAEVEMELQRLEGIHSAYVVGLPDKGRGQLVVAAVVAREGAKLDFAEIEATLRQKLSSFKVPRAYVEITREEVPMLPSNKVSRRLMERLVAERLGRSL
jgi:acyl-CoA synthetase (AMP-forming)/AMP-acid ligase II